MACGPDCNPVLLSETPDPDGEPVRQFFVSDESDYLCYNNGSIHKFDITDKSAPSLLGSLALSFNPTLGMSNIGSLLFVMETHEHPVTGNAVCVIYSVDSTATPPAPINTHTENRINTLTELAMHAQDAGRGSLFIQWWHHFFDLTGNNVDVFHYFTSFPSEGGSAGRASPDALVDTSCHPVVYIAVDPDSGVLYTIGQNVETSQGTVVIYSVDGGGITELGHVDLGAGVDILAVTEIAGIPDPITDLGQVSVENGYLYIPVEDNGAKSFAIVNAQNPSSPFLESITEVDGSIGTVLGCFARGGNLYLHNAGDGASQLEIWNITNKSLPTVCKIVEEEGGYYGLTPTPAIYAEGGYIYVGFSSSFRIYAAQTCLATSDIEGGASCFALGGYLFVADNADSSLKIFDVSDPTAPSGVASLSLPSAPEDVIVADSIVYLVAAETVYVVSIDDIENPELIATREGGAEQFVGASGGMIFTSGERVRAYRLKPDESDLRIAGNLEAPNGATGGMDFTRSRIFFADVPDEGTCMLRSYTLGGINCHHINAGSLSGEQIDAELIRARHVRLKGDVIANSATVVGDISGEALVIRDETGALWRVTVVGGNLTLTEIP